MTWRPGKYGHHTGRTVRSTFARGSSRREGILIRKEVRQTTETPEESQTERVVDSTHYSLGKQNRWLMPEMIKTSASPRDVVGEEGDFVLVEKRMNEKGTLSGRRGDCISVFNSSTKRTRTPRRKYGQAQSLLSDSRQTDVEFEVQYPNAKGVWPHNSEVKHSQNCRGKRKGSSKNRRGKWNESQWSLMVEEEDGYFTEEEEETFDNAEDFDEDDDMNSHDERRAELHFISLEEHIDQSMGVPCVQSPSNNNNFTINQEKSSLKSNVIVVQDEEEVTKHLRSFSRARETDALILSYLNIGSKLKRRKKEALTKYMTHLDPDLNHETGIDSSIGDENNSKESFSFMPEIDSSCEVCLHQAAIQPSKLREVWGENYRDGGSLPRKFAIDLSGLIKCSSEIVDLALMQVLFELRCDEGNTSNHCKASVRLVLHIGLAELDMSPETIELIKTDFQELVCEMGLSIVSVGHLVDIGVKCIEKYETFQGKKPMKASSVSHQRPFYTSDVFENVLGWKGKSFTEQEALTEIKKEIMEEIDPENFCTSSTPGTECGICLENVKDEDDQYCTMLITCGHSFCNTCWEVYLKTMLNRGETNLLCPGHRCQAHVDDITIMSLATSWYGKYFSWKIKKSLEKSQMWQHCPSEWCRLVMQVMPCNGARKPISDPLPVVCACNQTWCFKCQELAHWPSQCGEAQKFRTEYKEYASKMRINSKKREITSVMIKKCPNCSYPIEKFHGCNHMNCALCGMDFCWNCLSPYADHNYYGCKLKSIVASEVLLPRVNKTGTQTLIEIAVSSHYARNAGSILKMRQKLKSIEEGLQAYSCLKTKVFKTTKSSRMTSILEGMVKNNSLQLVKDAFNFKLQAHIVLEGLVIILIKGAKDNSLQNDLLRLLLFVEGLDNVLNNPCSVCNEEIVKKLTELVERGKLCVVDIKRHVKKYLTE